MRRLIAALVLLLALSAAAVAAAQPVPQPSVVIDRPSGGVTALTGLSLARDGTGGAVYLKASGGAQHVFVARLLSGSFVPPEQVDAGLSSASSQPVIAAGPSGMLLIAFINAGKLYVVSRASASSGYGAPQALAAGAQNPALALSIHGKGYLAFTMAGSGGHDVRAAYYVNGFWAVESAPLDASPANDVGIGAGRPQVAAAGDGVGIVVWGEAGHVYSRRVWATSPSVVFEQADVASFSGSSEVSADSPVIGTGDDSSFADVAFTERVSGAQGQVSRVLERRLRGSLYETAVAADGLPAGGPDSAYGPQIAESGQTHGLLSSRAPDLEPGLYGRARRRWPGRRDLTDRHIGQHGGAPPDGHHGGVLLRARGLAAQPRRPLPARDPRPLLRRLDLRTRRTHLLSRGRPHRRVGRSLGQWRHHREHRHRVGSGQRHADTALGRAALLPAGVLRPAERAQVLHAVHPRAFLVPGARAVGSGQLPVGDRWRAGRADRPHLDPRAPAAGRWLSLLAGDCGQPGWDRHAGPGRHRAGGYRGAQRAVHAHRPPAGGAPACVSSCARPTHRSPARSAPA